MYDGSYGLSSAVSNVEPPLQPCSPGTYRNVIPISELTPAGNPQVDLFSPEDLNQFFEQDLDQESKDRISPLLNSNISQDFSMSALGFNDLASPFVGVENTDQAQLNPTIPSHPGPATMKKSRSDSPVYHPNHQESAPSKTSHNVNTAATMALSTPRQANGQRRFNWAEMICYTIDESPDEKLFVQDLFERMVNKYPELRERAPEFNWEARVKNRIKSTLSTKSNLFIKLPRHDRPSGKGSWWALSPDAKEALRQGCISDAIKGIGFSPVASRHNVLDSANKESFPSMQGKYQQQMNAPKRSLSAYASEPRLQPKEQKSINWLHDNAAKQFPSERVGPYTSSMLARRRLGLKKPGFSRLNLNTSSFYDAFNDDANTAASVSNPSTLSSMFTQMQEHVSTPESSVFSLSPATASFPSPLPLSPGFQVPAHSNYEQNTYQPSSLCNSSIPANDSPLLGFMHTNNIPFDSSNMPQYSSETPLHFNSASAELQNMTISDVPDASESSMMNSNINNIDNSNDFSTDIHSLFGPSQTSSTTPVFSTMDQSQAPTSTSLPLDFSTTVPIENQGTSTFSCPEYTNNDMYDMLMNNILGSVASFRCNPEDTVDNSQSTSDPSSNNDPLRWNLNLG